MDVSMAQRIRNGYQPLEEELGPKSGFGGGYGKVVCGEKLVAIAAGRRPLEGPRMKLLRVFH